LFSVQRPRSSTPFNPVQRSSFFEVPPETLLFNITEQDRKKTGPPSKLDTQLEMIRKLSTKKQKTISEMLDMVLNK